jgi:hypothetical protein
MLLSHLSFCLSYEWTMHHSPGMNRNIWGVRLILRPCLEHRVLFISCVECLITMILSVGLTGRYTSSPNCPSVLPVGTPFHQTVRRSYRSVHQFTKLSVGLTGRCTSSPNCPSVLPVGTPVHQTHNSALSSSQSSFSNSICRHKRMCCY